MYPISRNLVGRERPAPPQSLLNLGRRGRVERSRPAFHSNFRKALLFAVLCTCYSSQAQEKTWEHSMALALSQPYRDNHARLNELPSEINRLPSPYLGEPTGSGGYLSSWLESPEGIVTLTLQWEREYTIDAIGLFPLRLYLGDEGGLIDNAYWPGSIDISARKGDRFVPIAQLNDTQSTIRKSLPEFVEFEAVSTGEIQIVCTRLAKRVGAPQYSAGFAEVLVFSENANIAPLSTVISSGSRQGYRVLATDFLVDEQTPLGLPELKAKTTTPIGLGLLFPSTADQFKLPYVFEITFEEPVLMNAVRLDPVVLHKVGQSFPVRFSIELLNGENQVLQSEESYRNERFPNPGLNPYTVYFDRAMVHAIRLTVLEASKPTPKSAPSIRFSEMAPMLDGSPLLIPSRFNNSSPTPNQKSEITDSDGVPIFWTLESAYDGMTQSGKVITHRIWVEALSNLQKLLEEELVIKEQQAELLTFYRSATLWTVSIGVVLIISIAAFTTIRSRIRAWREIQSMREQIASDLHDEAGSSLASISLRASRLLEKSKSPDEKNDLNAIYRLSRECSFGLREVLHTTTPRIGRAQNIVTYMKELAELILVDIPYTFDTSQFTHDKSALSPSVRKDLILFYKEALTNCQTHAQCSHVNIALSNRDNDLTLKIEDNGIGITSETLERPRTLRTLKQRADRLKGKLQIQSEANSGLKLTLESAF